MQNDFSFWKSKTFWLGLGTMAFGVIGVVIGEFETTTMVNYFIAGFGLITSRHAIAKI